MKTICLLAAAGFTLIGAIGPVSAQYGGGLGYGQQRPQYQQGEEDADEGENRARPRYSERGGEFEEGEYLRCNPDVRRAVERGTMPSAAVHYRNFGRREGRRLSC